MLVAGAIKLITVHVILTFLAAIALCLRVVAKYIRGRPWQLHDLLCLIGFTFLIGYIVCVDIGATHGGIGQHVDQLKSMDQLVVALKVFYVSTYIFPVATSCIRLSMISLYMEIFRVRKFVIAAWITAGMVIGFWIGWILTALLLCRPIKLNWDKSAEGTCGDFFKVEVANAAANMIQDLTITFLPMPMVWGLQMSMQKKVGISVAFGLGFVIAAINIGRIVQTVITDQNDFTYVAVDAAILAVAEGAVGVMVVCAPTLGPVFAPKRFGSKGYTGAEQPSRRRYVGLTDNNSKMTTAATVRSHAVSEDTELEALRAR